MTIFIGDSLTWLKKLPSDSVHCVVTSPPYYGLRDYGIAGQMGLEETPEQFLENMTTLFREVRRVLRHDGVAWVNMGDSYATSVNGRSAEDTKAIGNDDRTFRNKPFSTVGNGYKSKDLMMIPARLALSLQADGWWLRSQVVWHKPNPMPESVTDRPTKSHEFIYLLAKSERYWYDADAIRESYSKEYSTPASFGGFGNRRETKYSSIGNFAQGENSVPKPELGRNKRDVWTIPTQAFADAHFATFPMELAETCILAGCPETVCAVCGAGYVRVTEKTVNIESGNQNSDGFKGLDESNRRANYPRATVLVNTLGYEPACTCNAGTSHGMVLDPFGGAGTTALAAIKHNRHYQLIELNPAYVGIAQKRIRDFDPFQSKVFADGSKQLSLFAEVSA